MPRPTFLAVALPLLLLGCGGPDAAPQSAQPTVAGPSAVVSASGPAESAAASTPASTPPSTAPPQVEPSRSAGRPTSNVKDCYDGNCTLILSGPKRIPLNAKIFHFPAVRVVSITRDTLTYRVDSPGGGLSEASLSPGGGSSFGFRSFPAVQVTLISIEKGKAVLAVSSMPAGQPN